MARLTKTEMSKLPEPSFYVKASVRRGKLCAVSVGCREFGSFRAAFEYETGAAKFEDWQKVAYPLCAGDTGCLSCRDYFLKYPLSHTRKPSGERAPEIAHLWALQKQLERERVKLTPYKPKWLAALAAKITKGAA